MGVSAGSVPGSLGAAVLTASLVVGHDQECQLLR